MTRIENSRLRNPSLWTALSIVAVTIVLMFLVYFRVLRLHFLVGEFYLHHWFSWAGVLFIALFTPLYHVLKQRYLSKTNILITIHVFGSLISVMLISLHFMQQISRPPQSYPELGTGIFILYPSIVLLALTGFFLRFQAAKQWRKQWRFIHTAVAVTFYFTIVLHVLHGLEII